MRYGNDAKRLLALLALVVLAAALASTGMGLARLALARYMRNTLMLPAIVVSSFTTWFMAARAFSATIAGVTADRVPRLARHLMYLPLAAVSLVVYTVASLESSVLILASGALWGFLSGLAWPLVQTFTALAASSRSSTAMSVYFASGSLGMIAGQYLYGVLPLEEQNVIRVSSLFFAASAVLLAFASHAWSGDVVWEYRRGSATPKLLKGLKPYEVWILAAAFSTGFLAGTLREFLYVYLGEVYGLSRRPLASMLAGAGLFSIAASLAVGPLADRYGVVRVLRGILVLGALGGFILSLKPGYSLAFAGLVLVLAAPRSSLPLVRNATVFSAGRRASLVGLSNTLSNIGHLISPIIAGWLYDNLAGSVWVFNLKGVAFAVSALLLLAIAAVPVRVSGQSSGDSSPAQ